MSSFLQANQSERPTVVEEPVATPPASVPTPSSAIAAEPFSILGVQQEAINGRAAMIGFAIAIASELATGQSIWSQIAGELLVCCAVALLASICFCSTDSRVLGFTLPVASGAVLGGAQCVFASS